MFEARSPERSACWGETYSSYRLLLIPAAMAIGAGLAMVLQGTRLGIITRAVIMNKDLARGLGINSGLIRFFTFSLGAGLASLAGALITPLRPWTRIWAFPGW